MAGLTGGGEGEGVVDWGGMGRGEGNFGDWRGVSEGGGGLGEGVWVCLGVGLDAWGVLGQFSLGRVDEWASVF